MSMRQCLTLCGQGTENENAPPQFINVTQIIYLQLSLENF